MVTKSKSQKTMNEDQLNIFLMKKDCRWELEINIDKSFMLREGLNVILGFC